MSKCLILSLFVGKVVERVNERRKFINFERSTLLANPIFCSSAHSQTNNKAAKEKTYQIDFRKVKRERMTIASVTRLDFGQVFNAFGNN